MMRSHYFDRPTRSIISLTPPLYTGDDYMSFWEINRVSVLPPHRGQGLARKLMLEVLADADAEEIQLVLSVQPDASGSGLDFTQLTDWYLRCGFVPTNRFPQMMRPPHQRSFLGYVQAHSVRCS